MKLIPNKKKFKKYHKRGVSNNITNVIDLFSKYKNIRIKCLENANLTVNQIESFKNSIKKFMKKKGKFNIFLLADLPITKKPLEVRMGKGKGNVDS
jgi:large subunit ribosomal protein L16